MAKDAYFYLAVIVGVAVVLLASFILVNTNFSGYRHSVERSGILFASNVGEPAELASEMRGYGIFIVSPQFVEAGAENNYMVSSMTLFNAVLIAKNKSVIIVARVLDDSGNIVKCQTNFGDPKVNVEITAAECLAMVNNASNARIFVSLPDSRLAKPVVELEHGAAYVHPSSYESVSPASFELARALYSDAEAIIATSNIIVERL